VTKADLMAQKTIVSVYEQMYKGLKVVGEED